MGRQVSADKRRLAGEDVKTVKEDYFTIANLAGDLIVRIDKDGRFAFLNDAAIEFWGKPRKKIIGTHFGDYLYPEDKKKAMSTLQEMIKSKTLVKGFILRLKNPTGLRTVAWNVVPIFDESGDYVGTQATGKDLTELLRTEEELEQSRRQFHRLFELMVDPMAIIELNGNILEISKSAEETTGFKREEIVGKHFLETTVGTLKTNAIMTRNLQKIKKGMHIPVHTVELVTKDGRKLVCDLNLTKIMYRGETAILAIFHDITGEKKAEEALRISEEEAKRLLEFQNKVIDTATVWVNLLDLKGNVILWNRAAELVSGYSREEVIGHNKMWKWLYPDPNYRAKLFALGKKIGEKGKRLEDFYSIIRCKDGSLKTISWYATNVLDEKGKPAGSISVGIDVTERKKAQKAINKAMRLLKQSNDELESYTYVVSHDLKAPLRTIRSFGTFLLEDYGDKLDETGQDYLHRMVNASSRMDSMIEDLLILSRVGRKFTEFEKVDLNKLLEEILADIEMTIKERNAEVVVDKLPAISVQRIWMRQLFMNLINNGLKFNDSKTPKIDVLHQERETDHLFKVRDNGIGIEEKYLTRIFNLFERAPTQKKYEGTGAGLAICKKIVEQLEGKIWVESTPGEGSTFMFIIPKEIKKGEDE